MSNIKLYQCTADIQAVLNHHFDSETEAADTLEAVIGQFEVKAQSVIAYHMNQLAELEMLKAHNKAMKEREKTLQAQADKLKDYLHRNMLAAGIKEIKADDGTFTAKIAKNPVSVDVYDMTLLDPRFVRKKITYEPDKNALKEALENGEDVQGAKLVTDKTSLRIK
ncbi:siphovirus Gp157 family protein [Wielerella bovis]|uniref:siphovirus Gp157 family protein n=1 Tax=Wielerella bovis TaxID=2917790 RepID=UPI00201905B1|nr:siphovirus Gp157 family protein [Wielerella bovis]ULJ60818.1 siphovirus Gp157 family protein [Wielerella bovis]